MHLLDLFESTNEGYRVTPGINRERYQERRGLEGPFQTKSGKVVYYDPKQGQYYDPDSDMYIDDDDYRKLDSDDMHMIDLDEGVGTYLKGAVLAGLIGVGINQLADISSMKNTPLGQAMAQAAEQGDEYAATHLKKLDLYMDANDTGSLKILSKKYLNKTIESVYEEVASNKRTERILKLLRAKNPSAENDLEALILSFDKGQKMDREDINKLYNQNREEDREIEQLEKELEAVKKRRDMSEAFGDTDEQREVARLGRILMDMGKKRDDDIGAAMGAVGNELTKYGTPEGASNMRKLQQLTGQPESVIMKMMALAQKVEGDVAVGDETAGNNDEEKVNEVLRKVPYVGYKGPGSDFRAYDEPNVAPRRTARRDENNYAVLINGKTWKVFARRATAEKAAATIEKKYNKNTEVQPVSEGIAEDFDDRFRKHLDLYTKSQGVRDYRARKSQMNLDQMKAMDPSNPNPLIPNKPLAYSKARKAGVPQTVITTNQNRKLPEQAESPMVSASIPNNTSDTAARLQRLAKENGVEYARQGRTVTLTGPKMNVRQIFFKMAYDPGNHPEMVPVNETAETDIQVGDTVQTQKMGQMSGTVTGFSKKSGITKVLFKHESGKTYATVPENLRVISSKKTEGLDDTVVEAKKKPIPTKPDKWSYAKSQAKKKFDVYPSAYANAWAAKKYKELGGGWRMGTKEDLEEMEQQLEEKKKLKCWPGYERVPGTTAGEVGSCRKKGKQR